MQFFHLDTVVKYELPGVTSHQLISRHNAKDCDYTLTEVIVMPGATQPRHNHENSEQTWYCLSGTGVLLLADGEEREFNIGDVARFEKGDIHGLHNRADEPVRYISITNPRTDFSGNYDKIVDDKE